LEKLAPGVKVTQQACPIWVPLIEHNLHETAGGRFFIQQELDKLMAQDSGIDSVLLGCTHYPIIQPIIEKMLPASIRVLAQGELVADSLADYLLRHPEMENRCSTTGTTRYLTTENELLFAEKASYFLQENIQAQHIALH
jgi:glutamate racemase